LGEKYAKLLPIGEKICILPPSFIPFQKKFSPNLLFGHIFVKQKNINPRFEVVLIFQVENYFDLREFFVSFYIMTRI